MPTHMNVQISVEIVGLDRLTYLKATSARRCVA